MEMPTDEALDWLWKSADERTLAMVRDADVAWLATSARVAQAAAVAVWEAMLKEKAAPAKEAT